MNALRDTPLATGIARVLDFPGFYESWLSQGLDQAEEMEAEHIAETHGLDPSTVAEAMYECSDHAKGFDLIAREYVDWLNHVLEDTGIELTFHDVESPREYNFSTDVLFVTVNDPARILQLIEHERFAALIEEQFTSRSGFISFYSNDVEEWLDKPFDEWDHNEVGTLLTAFIAQRAEAEDRDFNDMLEWLNESFSTAVDQQTDWAKLGRALDIQL